MRATLGRSAVATVMAILLASPAIADPPAPARHKPLDPNQLVCEKQEVAGSRLATRRVCMTRAQWADLRLQDRQEIEKIQTRRGSCEGKACQ